MKSLTFPGKEVVAKRAGVISTQTCTTKGTRPPHKSEMEWSEKVLRKMTMKDFRPNLLFCHTLIFSIIGKAFESFINLFYT